MGAGISVEKTLQEAKEIIKRRLETTEKARSSLQQQLAQAAQRISEGREEFQNLVAEMRKEQSTKNV
jgi:prefoldin subunit 5